MSAGTLADAPIVMAATARIDLAVDDSGRTLSTPLYTVPIMARILSMVPTS
jgi:hypothetical protein